MYRRLDASQFDVKAAFDAACVDVFHSRPQRPPIELPGRTLLPRFAQHYQHLLALPRRARRSLQRQWKRTLGGVALLLALTPGGAFAETLNVTAGVTPDVNADGKCSLIEAIFNANTDSVLHGDCPAGSGADTIILPVGSKQVLTNSVGPLPGSPFDAQGVPKIRSAIVIEGRGSTVERADGSPIDLMIAIETNGHLTLNETIVSGRPAGAAATNNDVLCILNRGRLLISKSRILRGHDTGEATPSGGGGLRNEGTATLNNSTVANNESDFDGAGIYNRFGALVLSDSVVSDNHAGHSGGGIANYYAGNVTVRNSTITRNSSSSEGGGIDSLGTLTVDNSVISGNSAGGDGGGIWNGGTLTADKTVVSNNSAGMDGRGSGGGISHWEGTTTISRSTIADNVTHGYVGSGFIAHANGGGIDTYYGSMTLTNSTISGNRAQGYGGGIAATYGTLTLTHTTVTSNVAIFPPGSERYSYSATGGGVSVRSGGTVARFERSIISGNQSQGKGAEVGVGRGTARTIIANNFNVFGQSGKSGVDGFIPGPTDIVPAAPVGGVVMPLANNGGKGATHALAINSPALNAAPIDPKCPATDQRGNPRPQGVKCDIGSFEGSAVLCNGLITTQVGTNLADALTGTASRDIIAGLAGNDTIRGLNGNDVICAGSGADKVYGGNNNDLLFGDSENDQLYGDAGNDALNGGTGTDKCNGGSGTDTATQCETRTSVP